MSPASYLTAPPRVAAVKCTTVDLYHLRGVLAGARLLPRRRPRLDRLRRDARVAALEGGSRDREDRKRRGGPRHELGDDRREARSLADRRDRAPLDRDHAPAGVARGARCDPLR